MSEFDSIELPPYPNPFVTLPGMLKCLTEFRDWLESQRGFFEEHAGPDSFPRPLPVIPTLEDYMHIAVCDVYEAFILLQKIREQWDKLVRVFEDHWSNHLCVQGRLYLIGLSIRMLRDAFVRPETREARFATERKQRLHGLKKFFKDIGLDVKFLSVDGDVVSDETSDSNEAEDQMEELLDKLFNDRDMLDGGSEKPSDQ